MTEVMFDPYFLMLVSCFAGIGALVASVKVTEFILWIVEEVRP